MVQLNDLDANGLAAQAAEWRRRALRGEQKARGIAHMLEAELRRRLGVPQVQRELDTRHLALRKPAPLGGDSGERHRWTRH